MDLESRKVGTRCSCYLAQECFWKNHTPNSSMRNNLHLLNMCNLQLQLGQILVPCKSGRLYNLHHQGPRISFSSNHMYLEKRVLLEKLVSLVQLEWQEQLEWSGWSEQLEWLQLQNIMDPHIQFFRHWLPILEDILYRHHRIQHPILHCIRQFQYKVSMPHMKFSLVILSSLLHMRHIFCLQHRIQRYNHSLDSLLGRQCMQHQWLKGHMKDHLLMVVRNFRMLCMSYPPCLFGLAWYYTYLLQHTKSALRQVLAPMGDKGSSCH